MARIRTIKPEFWDSPDTARASLRTRLFFIAMWNWADDYGIGTANGKQLVGFAFPNDDNISAADYPTLVADVSDCFGVVFFEHEGRPFFVIPSWEKHQRTEKKAKRNEDLIAAAERAVLARNHAEVGAPEVGGGLSAPSVGDSPPGTGEREPGKGNRGTGEQGGGGNGDESPPSMYCKRHAATEGTDLACRACQSAWAKYEVWANDGEAA